MQARTVLFPRNGESPTRARAGTSERRRRSRRPAIASVPIRSPARSTGDDRGVAEAVARGLPELGGTDRLRGVSPPAATRSWEAASAVGLELRTNVWLQSVANVLTLRPGLSRSGRPRASPSHRDFPRSGSWTILCSATCLQRNAAQCGR